jgi:hypothetical protein
MGRGRRQTILLVQLLDLEGEFSLLHNLIVEFMPAADRRIFGSGEFSQRVEIEAIDNQA